MRASAPRTSRGRGTKLFELTGELQMKHALYFTAMGMSLFAIAPAFGADGYVTGDVNLRAGPDTNYPSVAMLPAGVEVAIEGCVDGWSWCDVAAGNNRGWVAGSFLQEEYQGQRVLVPEYGVRIGIPLVSFVFSTYWDENYRNRSWYGNREHWSHVTPRYHAASAHDLRRDGTHEDTNPHPRNTSVDASRGAPGRTADAASRQHELAATHPSRQIKPSKPTPEPHAVAIETRSREKDSHAIKPAEPHAKSMAPAPRAVAERNAPHPGIGAEHKADTKMRKPVAQKTAPEKKEDDGKGEH
jgi:uncharacterized protein YraI